MKNKIVVISDVHGNYDALQECLFNAGVLTGDGRRRTDQDSPKEVISIGDLANCVREDLAGDMACLNKVGDWIDVMLMGNHEIPYFDSTNKFSGFYYNDRIHARLLEIEEAGKLRPALLRKGVLISHAGWSAHLHPFIDTAEKALQALTEAYQTAGWSHRFFSQIGFRRGGNSRFGGILWEDWNDFDPPFPQIVGHTVGYAIRYRHGSVCIDTGGGKYGEPTALFLS